MNKKIILFFIIIFSLTLTSALSVSNVIVEQVGPGQEGIIKIRLDNEGKIDVQDVSLSINFLSNIIPIGSSESSVDEIKEDDDEEFAFKFKSSNTIIPGTYKIPYQITYEEDGDSKTQNGDFGIVIIAQPEIEVTIEPQNPIIGQTGEIQMKLVNKGLADARFVSVSVNGEGLLVLTDKISYVGNIDSDDFETTSFEVAYQIKKPILDVEITYRDFDNMEQKISKSLSFTAYTEKEAIEKGILIKSNLPLYVGALFLAIIVWLVFRRIRKNQKAPVL